MDVCVDCGFPENNHQFFHIYKSSKDESDLTIKPKPNSDLDQFFESPVPTQARTIKPSERHLIDDDPRCTMCLSEEHSVTPLTLDGGSIKLCSSCLDSFKDRKSYIDYINNPYAYCTSCLKKDYPIMMTTNDGNKTRICSGCLNNIPGRLKRKEPSQSQTQTNIQETTNSNPNSCCLM